MVFQCTNIRQVPWEVLKTEAEGLGFQHLPRDLANVNAWKTMFDPYIKNRLIWMLWEHMSEGTFFDVVAKIILYHLWTI